MIEALVGLLVCVVRSLDGYARGLARGRVTWSWKKLLETVLRVGLIYVAVLASLPAYGLSVDAWAGGASAFLADKLLKALKEHVPVRSRS